jgi:signal transduction histidine kinase
VAVFIDSMSPPPQAKEDIDRLNDRLRQVTSAMSVAIFEYEFKTCTSIISDEHLASLNLTRDHLPATPEDWFDLLRPLDPDAYWQNWKRAMSPEGEGRFSFEVRPLVNGQERQMELQAHVRFSGQGSVRQPERMFGMLVDHTENRRMQAALSRAQRQETVGRMAGMVAHDFNNILTVILANIELAELRTADPELHQLLRNATNAAEMGASFNKRLLALAGGHRAQVAALPVAVDEHIARTWAVFQRVLSDELSLVFHPGAPNAVVAIDPAEIDGAILNLVMNARDAQMEGGTIMLETSCLLGFGQTAKACGPPFHPHHGARSRGRHAERGPREGGRAVFHHQEWGARQWLGSDQRRLVGRTRGGVCRHPVYPRRRYRSLGLLAGYRPARSRCSDPQRGLSLRQWRVGAGGRG